MASCADGRLFVHLFGAGHRISCQRWEPQKYKHHRQGDFKCPSPFQMPRVNMWGLSLYCCDSLKCYTAEQRLLTLGNQSCSQLPAGQTRKRGLLPRSGGMRSPFGRGSSHFGRRRWRRLPPWPWEGPFLQTAAIRQAKTVCLCVLTSVSSCCIHNHIRCILV